MALVDSGQYAETWFHAAGPSNDENWKNALEATHSPLGKVESRQRKSATYTDEITNA